MDLRGYLRAVRKYWWIVLFVTLLGVGGAVIRNERATAMYSSSVTFFVSTPSGSTSSAFNADQFAQRRANSYAGVLTSERLAKLVIRDTGLRLSPTEVSSKIKASVQLNTVLLTATVTDSSPDRALEIATAISSQFGGLVDQLDNVGSKAATVALNVVSGPSVSRTPISPRKNLNLAVGVAIGLLLGLAAAVARELADNTLRTPELLREVSGVPVLGNVGYDSSAKKKPLIVGSQLRSLRAEAFRQLRTNLQFADVDNPVKVLVVTSSTASEGKTTTATNLAIMFAESNMRVLLIEADMRRPRVMDYLGMERAVGLTNVLAGRVDVDDVLQKWGDDDLWVLPSGSIPPNPSELLGSQNMVDLVDELRSRFDMIIIDTPPLLPVTDAAVASALADGVVLVVRYGKTSRAQVTSAVRSLESVDARVLGAVFNMRSAKSLVQSGYDGYGYYEDKPNAAPTLDEVDSRSGVVARNRHAEPDVDADSASHGYATPDLSADIVDDQGGVTGASVAGEEIPHKSAVEPGDPYARHGRSR
jgi:capsular exopolysaccharide synthesis family protein